MTKQQQWPSRRRVMQSLALAGGAAIEAPAQPQPPAAASAAPSMDALRAVAEAHGLRLSDERLRILQPVLARRTAQLRPLREFEIDDRVEPK